MQLTKKGKELLLRVRERILEEPARIRMAEWYNGPEHMGYIESATPHARVPPCNTVACIAGWVVIEGGTVNSDYLAEQRSNIGFCNQIPVLATELIYGPEHEILSPARMKLFHEDRWPDDLYYRIMDLNSGTPEYAAVVAAAIDRWIVADGDPERFQAP